MFFVYMRKFTFQMCIHMRILLKTDYEHFASKKKKLQKLETNDFGTKFIFKNQKPVA